jgi:hypothetical protein
LSFLARAHSAFSASYFGRQLAKLGLFMLLLHRRLTAELTALGKRPNCGVEMRRFLFRNFQNA